MKQYKFDALLRSDFRFFAFKCFAQLHPGQSLSWNWHLDAIGYKLERLREGKTQRLILNLPPRNLKSELSSVYFVALLLGHDPTLKIICASYSQDLANNLSRKTRTIMESTWYRRAFSSTRIKTNRNTESDFETTEEGGRKAGSFSGSLTGFGCDVLIVDDPQSANCTKTERQACIEFFNSVVSTRLDNPKEGMILVCQQRVHSGDLSGYLLKKGGWEHLCLPAIATEDIVIEIGAGKHHHYQKDVILDDKRFSLEHLKQQQIQMGPGKFSAQYQQKPVPETGNIIKLDWFKYYDGSLGGQAADLYVHSWDLAFKSNRKNDYTVGTFWLVRDAKFYLVNLFRDQLDYGDLARRISEYASLYRATHILVEENGAGIGVVEDLRVDYRSPVIGIKASLSKKERADQATGQIMAEKVFLPKEAFWLADFLEECAAFPEGDVDDQVDSLSQFLNWARDFEYDSKKTSNFAENLKAFSDNQVVENRSRSPRQFREWLEHEVRKQF